MNVLTIPISRTATNVVPETVWPRQPISRIRPDPFVGTTLGPYNNEWTESPSREAAFYWQAYYKAVLSTLESENLDTWTVHTVFTPPTESHFHNRILQAQVPAKWILEGVQPPTAICRANAYEVWQRLYTKFGLLPIRVS